MDENVKKEIENHYFAAKEAKKTAAELLDRAKTFYNRMESNQYLDKLQMMWKAYHGAYSGDDGHQISFTGEQGELVQLPVNHFRNIAQHIYVMITGNRPIMEARAINTDYKSLSQTYLAQGILDYYMRERHLEDALKKAVELAIVLGAGFIKLEWNATAGEAFDYDEETGQFNYEGDLQFSNLSPFDVIVDGTKESWDHNWIMTRGFKNRYDLMAKYPEYADKIRSIASKGENDQFRVATWSNDTTEDIPVFEFYHKRTEALPNGRYILFLSEDVVLLDANLPYRTIPIFRIAPSDILGTTYGYTPMFDIFPLQEGVNSIYSSIMTNQNAFLVQSLFVPRGADLAVNTLGEGMNIVEGNTKPEPLQLTQTPPEAFEFLNGLIQAMETLSGVNSVARGNPEASLKSGAALALVQSMALQFMSGLQQSYVKMIEDVGSSLIQILKDFAATPRVIAIVGKNNRPLLKEFTGESISAINRVVVDVGNPLSRTISGRVQMAEQMLQMKLLRSPEQYFQVLNTGRLDSSFEGDMLELLLIKSENEKILEGDAPIVSPLDQHSLHIREHKAVIADPELRNNPDLVRVALDHIEQHLNALRNTDPALLQMVGEAPLPPLEQMLAPPGPEGDPNQPPVKSLQNSPTPEMLQGGPPTEGPVKGGNIDKAQGENVPNLPKVPAEALANPALQDMAMGNLKQ
jgi:hypothetical protein